MLRRILPPLAATMAVLILAAPGGEITYQYDSRNQLTNSVYSQGVVATYRYDAASNIRDVKLIKDTDGDGLPDYWELLYFGSLAATDGTKDSDSDGMSDYEEYLAGTDPTSNDSALRSCGWWGGYSGPVGYTVQWSSASNRYYTIQWTTSLFTNFVMLATNLPGNPPQNSYFHKTAVSNAFYRVILQDTDVTDGEVVP